MKKISIITPCFNEESNIVECIEEVQKVFKCELPNYDFEHIFCDNCSSDRTVEILRMRAAEDKRIKIIINSRNFGILKNTYNGVLNANGDAIILFMPADLQDPPELIPEFVKHWEMGYEIVYGIRQQREEGFCIRNIRKAYYRLLSACTYIDYPPDVGDYQLIDRIVLNAMKKIDDAQPFMRLMTFDCGFRKFGIPYTWRARKKNVSKNKIMHMVDQGMNGIISFSNVPLRLAIYFGLTLSGFSFLYAFGVLILAITGQTFPAGKGIPTVIVAIFFFSGIQLLFAGILGEYILAIYNQVRRRPLIIERERINFD